MSDFESKRVTFWKMISDNEIIIPIYQRDYVQGRTDSKSKLIRTGLVNDLYEALTSEEKEKTLNFIYGGNDEDIRSQLFTPVDGQQRLTTLFVLHWYIFAMAGMSDVESEVLSKFSYATRTTSRRFCKEICRIKSLNFDPTKEGKISSIIKNYYWFTGNMESDPSVKHMLNMLDEIAIKFGKQDFEKIKNRLIDNCPITFLSLDIHNVLGTKNSVRELYVKMNARGKALTDFEIFKAQFQASHLLEELINTSDEFEKETSYEKSRLN